MSRQVAANVVHALIVGLICAVVIGIYAELTVLGIVENPLYWACFIMIPVVFMYGGKWSDVPFHWINLLIGLFLGGALTFAITGAMVAATGLAIAFAVATCIGTFFVQGLTTVFTPGVLKPGFGRCPMAFIGMIACFAAGGENYVVLVVSLLIGVVTSTLMAQSGKLAAKIVGLEPPTGQNADD